MFREREQVTDWMSVEFSFLLLALGHSLAVCWQEDVAGTIRMRNDSEVWANLQDLQRGETWLDHTHSHTSTLHMHSSQTTPRIMYLSQHPQMLVLFETDTHHNHCWALNMGEKSLTFICLDLYVQCPCDLTRATQTKGKEALRETSTADLSFHSCFTALMNYFQAMVIHHKADNESSVTAPRRACVL